MDRLSAALTGRIRKITKDKKLVPYSLRHNFMDRMRAVEAFSEVMNALTGHKLSGGQGATYGSGVALEQKRKWLQRAMEADGYQCGE